MRETGFKYGSSLCLAIALVTAGPLACLHLVAWVVCALPADDARDVGNWNSLGNAQSTTWWARYGELLLVRISVASPVVQARQDEVIHTTADTEHMHTSVVSAPELRSTELYSDQGETHTSVMNTVVHVDASSDRFAVPSARRCAQVVLSLVTSMWRTPQCNVEIPSDQGLELA